MFSKTLLLTFTSAIAAVMFAWAQPSWASLVNSIQQEVKISNSVNTIYSGNDDLFHKSLILFERSGKLPLLEGEKRYSGTTLFYQEKMPNEGPTISAYSYKFGIAVIDFEGLGQQTRGLYTDDREPLSNLKLRLESSSDFSEMVNAGDRLIMRKDGYVYEIRAVKDILIMKVSPVNKSQGCMAARGVAVEGVCQMIVLSQSENLN